MFPILNSLQDRNTKYTIDHFDFYMEYHLTSWVWIVFFSIIRICVGRHRVLQIQTYSIVTFRIGNQVHYCTTRTLLSDIYIELVHVGCYKNVMRISPEYLEGNSTSLSRFANCCWTWWLPTLLFQWRAPRIWRTTGNKCILFLEEFWLVTLIIFPHIPPEV